MGTRRKRRLHIDGKEWTYIVVHDRIEIRDINNAKHLTDTINLPGNEGWTWDLIERAKWKGNTMPSITPAAVKYYIETKILGKNLPAFVQRHDDVDHRQEEINSKHWVRTTHRVLRYHLEVGYMSANDDFENVDLGLHERMDAVPFDVINETLAGLEKAPVLVHFKLDTNGKTVSDSALYIYPRPEMGAGVYAVFSRDHRGGYAAYHKVS